MESSMYDQIGGKEVMNTAVILFYEKVMNDPMISYFFANIDMDAQIKKQKKFLTYALGSTDNYDGISLRETHRSMVNDGLNKIHFDRVINHLKNSLTELGVKSNLVEQVIEVAKKTEPDILDKNYVNENHN